MRKRLLEFCRAAALVALCGAAVLSAARAQGAAPVAGDAAARAQEAGAEGGELHRLPGVLAPRDASATPFLAGCDAGLFRVRSSGVAEPLWTEGAVERLIRAGDTWYFVTDKGIISSQDLVTFTERNEGLPTLMMKEYDEDAGEWRLECVPAPLKDISYDPLDPLTLVTATRDAVFLTRDGGATWTSLGSASPRTPGIKSVAVAHMPAPASPRAGAASSADGVAGAPAGSELVVFMSHPIYGFSYMRADAARAAWVDVSAGFAALPGATQPDEVSDLLPVLCRDETGALYCELYASQTFLPNIYCFNWQTKRAELVYAGGDCGTIDGLCQDASDVVFTTLGEVRALSLEDGAVRALDAAALHLTEAACGSPLNCAYASAPGISRRALPLSELWLLTPGTVRTPRADAADGRRALYASVYQLREDAGIEKYHGIIERNKLNAVVIDMKDDYGLLRFEPQSALLRSLGRVTQYKVDVERVVSGFKEAGVYLIARIVVFKDRQLALRDGGRCAVWDSRTGGAWTGIRGRVDVTDEQGVVIGQRDAYYDENWVDPYCEEVWRYNAEIARELVERGFDEIQFDYIRFPTDGVNLSDATFRWRRAGETPESALASFLSYARSVVKAPLAVDIYGANGWYRSGTRTGQDAELLARYVDVICPMFYPSHFEQGFLDASPRAERPYNIYFYGTYRNTVIARNRVVVRPWVQAFYLDVSYDREFYNANYVLREVFGVRDGINRGWMYWNNSGGNYDDIRPSPEDDEISPWHAVERDLHERVPAFSAPAGEAAAARVREDAERRARDRSAIWDSVQDAAPGAPGRADGGT